MARIVYEMPLHQQPLFREYLHDGEEYPQATKFSEKQICLPLWRGTTDEQVEKVISVVSSFFDSSRTMSYRSPQPQRRKDSPSQNPGTNIDGKKPVEGKSKSR